jgi:hypothetical protein
MVADFISNAVFRFLLLAIYLGLSPFCFEQHKKISWTKMVSFARDVIDFCIAVYSHTGWIGHFSHQSEYGFIQPEIVCQPGFI